MKSPALFVSQVQFILPEVKSAAYTPEIIDFFEAGVSVDECVAQMRTFLARDTIRGISIPTPRPSTGRQPSASLAAARLVRDYGKNRALHMAVQAADTNPQGSRDFAFWAEVGTTLL